MSWTFIDISQPILVTVPWFLSGKTPTLTVNPCGFGDGHSTKNPKVENEIQY